MKLRYRLLALDMDGTLLDEERRIDEVTARKICAIAAMGVEVVLCSGRRFSATVPYAKELGLSGPVVVNNGTIVKEVASGRTIYADYFPRDQLEAVLLVLRGAGLPAILLTDEYPDCDFYVDVAEDGNEYHMEYISRNRDKGRVVEDLATVRCEKLAQVVVFHTYPTLVAAEEKIREALNGKVASVIARNVRYKGCSLEIAAPTASKWTALKWVAQQHGIEPEEIVAIGDDATDVEMVREAGYGVAVANALDEVRAVADYVATHPRNLGVGEVVDLLLR